MPGNPKTMIHKTKLEQEDLETKSELYRLGELRVKPPKEPRLDTRIRAAMDEIYQTFIDNATKSGKLTKLPSTVFEPVENTYARTTINRAKKALQIKSIRRINRWWWTYPKKAPNEAMEAIHQRLVKDFDPTDEQMTLIQRPAAIELQEILTQYNYEITNTLAIQLMEASGYKRHTTLHMKAGLGIVSSKESGTWMWYWPNRIVQDWLVKKLSQGPVPHQRLQIEAFEEHSWSFELIKFARVALGHIHWRIIGGVGFWLDINASRQPTRDSIVEVDMLPEPDDEEREVIVDFEPSEKDFPEHDLAPEPGKVDKPVTSHHEVKLPSGVKLEVFE